jgi:hypothetical protein
MICTTVRNGKECPFMTQKGCSYNGGLCHEIVEYCEGCNRKVEASGGWYCQSFPEPALKWKNGPCNMASHISAAAAAEAKINPLKASKRQSKRK